MENAITEFFAAATSKRFAPNGCAIFGVIAYAYGFFFVPRGFFAGQFDAIAKSAAVDAGVAENEIEAWIEANADKIGAATTIIGDVHGPRRSVRGDATWLLDNGITPERYEAAVRRRLRS